MLKEEEKRVLLILADTDKKSFCAVLKRAYIVGAKEAKAEIKELNLGDLKFDPVLHNKEQPLEPCLKKAQEYIKWSNHIVFIYQDPWNSMPALLKGFIDRTFLPGFAFKYKSPNSLLWSKLLKKKSARLIIVSDKPRWYSYLYLNDPGINMMKRSILGFCGISPVRATFVGTIKKDTKEEKDEIIVKIIKLGQKIK